MQNYLLHSIYRDKLGVFTVVCVEHGQVWIVIDESINVPQHEFILTLGVDNLPALLRTYTDLFYAMRECAMWNDNFMYIYAFLWMCQLGSIWD